MSAARRLLIAFALLWVAGCAAPETAPAPHDPQRGQDESVVPGTIGVVVQSGQAGVVIAAVGRHGPAAAAGLRVGDVVLRYNGASVTNGRQFYALVLDSPPGSTARVDVLREGKTHRVDVRVEEIDTALRA